MKTWTPDGAARAIAQRHGEALSRLRASYQVQKTLHDIQRGRPVAPEIVARMPPHWIVEEPQRHRAILRAVTEQMLKVSVILTHDIGTHESAWWRNSDMNECIHLSLVGQYPGELTDLPEVERRAWGLAVFGPEIRKTWWEPPADAGDPYRDAPASRYTHHLRLFLDRQGHPIVPQGEVYSLVPWDDGTSPEKIYRQPGEG